MAGLAVTSAAHIQARKGGFLCTVYAGQKREQCHDSNAGMCSKDSWVPLTFLGPANSSSSSYSAHIVFTPSPCIETLPSKRRCLAPRNGITPCSQPYDLQPVEWQQQPSLPQQQQQQGQGQRHAPRRLCDLSPTSLRSSARLPATCTFPMPMHRPMPSSWDVHEFMASAMRLLGYEEHTTIRLALHCWQRVEKEVRAWTVVVATPPELMRSGALAVLWVAAKLEEHRPSQAKPNVVATLLPPTLASLGASGLMVLELEILKLLGWSPYSGYLMD